MLIAFTFFVFVFQNQAMNRLKQIKYDISTVTASDFTVELDISAKAFQNFLKNEYMPKMAQTPHMSKAKYLKQYLKTRIESILTKSYQAKKTFKQQNV